MTALFSSCEQPNLNLIGGHQSMCLSWESLFYKGFQTTIQAKTYRHPNQSYLKQSLPSLGVVEFHIPRIPYLVVQVERAEQPIFFSSHLQIHHIVSVGGVWLAWSPKGLNSHPIPPFPKPLKSQTKAILLFYCKVDKFIGKGRILSFSFNSTMSPF